MQSGNAPNRGQSKSCSAVSCGEERVEDARQVFLLYARAIVTRLNNGFLLTLVQPFVLNSRNPNRYLSACLSRLDSVDNEVKNCVFNLSRVHWNYHRAFRWFQSKCDIATA